MVLGESAAVAAAMSLDGAAPCDVQAVDGMRLRARLLADGQVLHWPPASDKRVP